jgi:hypothetical protein
MVTGQKIMVDNERSIANDFGLADFFERHYEYWHGVAELIHNALSQYSQTSDLRYQSACVGEKTLSCIPFGSLIAAHCKNEINSGFSQQLRHVFGMCCIENGKHPKGK